MVGTTTGIEWGALAAAGVTLVLGILNWLRPTADPEARRDARRATDLSAEAKLLVDSAMTMARQASEDAETARERAGMAEARAQECHRQVIALDRKVAALRMERDQLRAEVEGLAGIVNDKVLGLEERE